MIKISIFTNEELTRIIKYAKLYYDRHHNNRKEVFWYKQFGYTNPNDIYSVYSNEQVKTMDDLLKYCKVRKPEDRKVVFNDIKNDYIKNHENSRKVPTYFDIAQKSGIMSERRLSDILNYNQDPTRQEVLLLCYTLNANVKNINRLLIACGQKAELLSIDKASEYNSIEDLIINAMNACREDDSMTTKFAEHTALDGYNLVKRRLSEATKQEL